MMNKSTNIPAAKPNEAQTILFVFLESLILFLSLSGNSLVIYTIRKERKLQTTCNYLLLNLAFCDIVVVSLGTSWDIMHRFTNWQWMLGSFLCRMFNPALTMFYISGSSILVVISTDRYKMFVHPLKPRYQRKHMKYAIFVVHSISFCCVLPLAVVLRLTDGSCYEEWPEIWQRKAYTVFLFLVQYALPLTIMGFEYTAVAISLLRKKTLFRKPFNCRKKSTPIKLIPVGHARHTHDGSSGRKKHPTAGSLQVILESNFLNRNETPLQNDINVGASMNTMCKNNKNIQNKKEDKGSNEENTKEWSKRADIDQQDKVVRDSPEVPEQSSSAVKRRTANQNTTRCKNTRRPNESPTLHYSGMLSKQSQRNNRALKMIFLVVVVFAVFMLPGQILSILFDFGKPAAEVDELYAWFNLCSYFGSCTLNPFIYGLVDRTFRAGFKKFAARLAAMWKC